MQRREEMAEEQRKIRNQQILEDYARRDGEGKFVMTVKEIANKYKISIPLVYKILEKTD